MTGALGEAVQRECSEASGSLPEGLTPRHMKSAAPVILDRIMRSPELRECLGRMRLALSAAEEEMVAEFDEVEADAVAGELAELTRESERGRQRQTMQFLWPQHQHGGGDRLSSSMLFGLGR